MIDAKELRIGNLITQGGGHILEVTSILTHGVQCFNKTYGFKTARFLWNELIPIAITPEWLKNFGFTKSDNDGLWYIQIGNTLYIEVDSDLDLYINPETWRGQFVKPWADIKHVHQLQNLYYFLTGKDFD